MAYAAPEHKSVSARKATVRLGCTRFTTNAVHAFHSSHSLQFTRSTPVHTGSLFTRFKNQRTEAHRNQEHISHLAYDIYILNIIQLTFDQYLIKSITIHVHESMKIVDVQPYFSIHPFMYQFFVINKKNVPIIFL